MPHDSFGRDDWCLVTDIDGTLIGESESSLALRDCIVEERRRMASMGRRLWWIIATGRGIDSAREVVVDQGFPIDLFDAWITSVGAEIYWDRQEAPCPDYTLRLSESGFQAASVRQALSMYELQPPHEQLPHKVSFYVRDRADQRAKVHAALEALPFATTTVFSHDDYLDVMPAGSAKGGAVEFVRGRLGLPAERVAAAGDSGNDFDMLCRTWHGIVVGNGWSLRPLLDGHPRVTFATARYAGGVLEGLRRLGLVP